MTNFIEECMDRQKRSRRFQCGDEWDGSTIIHLLVVTDWNIVMFLEDGRRLVVDPADRVLEESRVAVQKELCSALQNGPVDRIVFDPPKRTPESARESPDAGASARRKRPRQLSLLL